MAHKRKPHIYLGRRVRFTLDNLTGTGTDNRSKTMIYGVVSYINRNHRWFLVDVDGLRTCFHFSDIGSEVFVVGT